MLVHAASACSIRVFQHETWGKGSARLADILPKIGLKAGYFCPEFEQFKHVLSLEFTHFENLEPLLMGLLNRPIVELLNIHPKLSFAKMFGRLRQNVWPQSRKVYEVACEAR
jgi:hypothetical protein